MMQESRVSNQTKMATNQTKVISNQTKMATDQTKGHMLKGLRTKLPIIGLIICLVVMYATNVGIPGIEQYYNGTFKLLDMRYSYTMDTVSEMMTQLGTQGIQHYLMYLVLDVVFIVFLFLVQRSLSILAAGNSKRLRICLMISITGRGVLDIIEDLLLSLILRHQISLEFVTVASCITSLKFVCMGAWLVLICVGVVFHKLFDGVIGQE